LLHLAAAVCLLNLARLASHFLNLGGDVDVFLGHKKSHFQGTRIEGWREAESSQVRWMEVIALIIWKLQHAV
jgi:hypothetical protein